MLYDWGLLIRARAKEITWFFSPKNGDPEVWRILVPNPFIRSQYIVAEAVSALTLVQEESSKI